MNCTESSKLFLLRGAGVAELADAQDLGSCGVTPVEVQVLSPAPFVLSDAAAVEDYTTRTTFIRNATIRVNPDPASDANDR